MIVLDYSYIVRFVFKEDDVPTTPDNPPTAVLLRNGTAANASPVTAVVTAVAGETGEYQITFDSLGTAEGWATTDLLELRVKVNHGGSERVELGWNTYGHPDAPMRGSDTEPATPVNVTAAQDAVLAKLPANLVNGHISASVAEIDAAVRVILDAVQPDYAPAKAGDEMALPNSTLTALFSDADVADLVNQIIAQFDQAEDLLPQQIAAATRDAILDRLLAGNHDTAGTVGNVLQFLDALISSRATEDQIGPALTTVLNTYDPPTKAEMDAAIGALDVWSGLQITTLLTDVEDLKTEVKRMPRAATELQPGGAHRLTVGGQWVVQTISVESP